jgi:hypothetical protein
VRALIPRTNLQQLCAPIIEHRTVLPQRQRDALESVFGLGDAPAPDRFLVGLAVIGLLDAAAQDRAVLCIVDDVQWLDDLSAQTLFFIARRLLAEPVGLLFAVREPVDGMAGLPQLPIQGYRTISRPRNRPSDTGRPVHGPWQVRSNVTISVSCRHCLATPNTCCCWQQPNQWVSPLAWWGFGTWV